MNAWLAVAVMGAGIFAVRASGLLLPDMRRIERWQHVLDFLPAAILGALFVSTLIGQQEDRPLRLAAAAGAGLVGYLSGRGWICIVCGLVFFWLLRLV